MPIQTRRSVLTLSKVLSSPARNQDNNETVIPVTPSPARASRKRTDSAAETIPQAKKKKVESDKASATTPRTKTRKKLKSKRSEETKYPPPNEDWESIYALVEELRKDRTAPCDHSGCEALPERDVSPVQFRFQVLISLMLSSQTKDAVVGAAIRQMQTDGVLSVEGIAALSAEKLQSYIQKVGFHNMKTKYIQDTVHVLQSKYKGDIPPTAAAMIADLPGVGPKMAFICESVAWGRSSGIGVDTHMHRLFNKLEWVKAKSPEQTRKQLESWLPRSYWNDVNLLWVGFGQEVQQEKEKLYNKALKCSRPDEAVQLLKRCGMKID